MITGIDLVKWQIAVAAGVPLDFGQDDVVLRGHALECRINAENPSRDFMPCPGRIFFFHAPGGPGVRVDSHIYSEYQVPPYYDSLLAKLITFGKDRDEAVRRMSRALQECVIEGVPTSIPFHREVLRNPIFLQGKATTKFLDTEMSGLKEAIEARVVAEEA
jgi:acetyl-CoA carboxylase biotin carboxylase subunit